MHNVLFHHFRTVVNRMGNPLGQKRQNIQHEEDTDQSGTEKHQQDAVESVSTLEVLELTIQFLQLAIGVPFFLLGLNFSRHFLHFLAGFGVNKPASSHKCRENQIHEPFHHSLILRQLRRALEVKYTGYYSRRAFRPSSMSFQKCFEFASASSSASGRLERNLKSENVPLCKTRWTITEPSFTSK